ncbi:MAG TPA: hypothetical protein VGK43_03540 [Solirubrobacterales bacterium]
MDSYSFTFDGVVYTVSRAHPGSHYAHFVPPPPRIAPQIFQSSAACAEILRLAEENQRLGDTLTSERDVIEGTLAAINRVEEERDALKLTAEEGQEIIGELSMALAVLAGERLLACLARDPQKDGDSPGVCRGHLGPQAAKAVDHALSSYRALLEGNRLAAERIVELEGRCEGLNRQAVEAQERNALLEARIRDLEVANLRLMKEVGDLTSILDRQRPLADLGQAPETVADRLRRLIRERENLREEVRIERHFRFRNAALIGPAAKLLALLDSEEPPDGFVDQLYDWRDGWSAGGSREAARNPWRWLREQVAHQPPPPPAPEGA